MTTGLTSVANLPELTAIYPFAGSEWLFALIALAFTVTFVISQVRMERAATHRDMELTRPKAAIQPAE